MYINLMTHFSSVHRRRTKHQEETGRSDEVVINMAATGARSGATSANINSYIDADDCRM